MRRRTPEFRQYGDEPSGGEQGTPPQLSDGQQIMERKPDARTVSDFHTFADTDTTEKAIHHTLGDGPNQAASGSHRHDGGDSVLLLEGFSITGNKATPETVFPSIIQCLTRLGATDATT